MSIELEVIPEPTVCGPKTNKQTNYTSPWMESQNMLLLDLTEYLEAIFEAAQMLL